MKMIATNYHSRSVRKRTAVLEAELKAAEEEIKAADEFISRLVSQLRKGQLPVELVDCNGSSVTIKAVETKQKSE